MSIVETMYTGISDFKDIKQTTTYSFWTNKKRNKDEKCHISYKYFIFEIKETKF